jgi:hypothetical protein
MHDWTLDLNAPHRYPDVDLYEMLCYSVQIGSRLGSPKGISQFIIICLLRELLYLSLFSESWNS